MARSYLFIFLIFCFVSIDANAQDIWGWALDGFAGSESKSVVYNQSGEAYVCGHITSSTNFTAAVSSSAVAGGSDVYLAKYAPNGALIWAQSYNGTGLDKATDLAIGSDGQVVLTGTFTGTFQAGSFSVSSQGAAQDVFILKVNAFGQPVWLLKEGGSGIESTTAITIDAQLNVLICGQFTGQSTLQGSSYTSLIDPQTNIQGADIFVAKYSAQGTGQWLKTGVGNKNERAQGIGVNAQNEVYICGQFSQAIDFAGSTISNLQNNIGFLAKLNPNGNFVFFEKMLAGTCLPQDLSVSASNEVVVVGDVSGNLIYNNPITTVTNAFGQRIFVLKTNANGTLLWATAFGSNSGLTARSVSVASDQKVYVTGGFNCAFDQMQTFPNMHEGFWNSLGYRDVYVLCLQANGNLAWSNRGFGKKDDLGLGIANFNAQEPVVVGFQSAYQHFSTILPPTPIPSSQDPNALQLNSSFSTYDLPASAKSGFVAKVLQANTDTFSYFILPDTLVGFIEPDLDTVSFCANQVGLLEFEPQTGPYNDPLAPFYTVSWSDGTIQDAILPSATGWYTAEIVREDGCGGSIDSIYVVLMPVPSYPYYTDTLGLFVNTTGPILAYYSCLDPPVVFNLDSICSGCVLSVPGLPGTGTGPYQINQSGVYAVSLSLGVCTQNSLIDVNFYDTLVFPPVVPALLPAVDTFYTCGDFIEFNLTDSLTNPTLNSSGGFAYHTVDTAIWIINGQQFVETGSSISYLINSSGWVNVSVSFDLTVENDCEQLSATYSLQDSVYVVVYNPPSIQITPIIGDTQICPGDSIILSINPTIPGCNWSMLIQPEGGAGIIWQSQDGDSIAVDASCLYAYGGSFIDPISGCSYSVDTSIYVEILLPPEITITPSDAILCPNDSLLLQVPNSYQTYQWVGPGLGTSLGSSSLYAATIGEFYCIVTDSNSCVFSSPPVLIENYVTPSLSVQPTNILCGGNSVELFVLTVGSPILSWWPIISNSNSIIVDQPGYYGVSIEQCGFTILDSMEVIDGTFSASISAADTMLCYQETILIEGSLPNANYEWSPAVGSSASILQVSAPGTYSAIVTNEFGCQFSTNEVSVGVYQDNIPVASFTDTVCPLSTVVLQASIPENAQWYASDSVFLTAAPTFTLTALTQDSVLLLNYPSANCPNSYASYQIILYDSLPEGLLQGPSVWCNAQPLTLQFLTQPQTDYIWFNQDSSQLIQTVNSPGTYWITYSRCGQSITDSLTISDHSIQLALNATDSLICMNSTSGGLTEVLLLVNSNASQFSWNVPFDTLHPQQIVVSSPGVYTVYATNDFGCSAKDSLSINGVDCNAEVPNVITPNGDGINDVLLIADAALHPYNKLIVLNRWGNVLFEAAPYLNNYSPTDLVDGTYFYLYYPNVLQKPLFFKQGFFMLFGE
jgi:hypothetical protein